MYFALVRRCLFIMANDSSAKRVPSMPTTQQATFHCEKCGKTIKATSEQQAPTCCGTPMKKTNT